MFTLTCAALVITQAQAPGDRLCVFDQRGAIRVLEDCAPVGAFRDWREVVEIRIGLHGLEWDGSNQSDAKDVKSTTTADGRRFEGRLPIPHTDGGELKFVETARRTEEGLRLEYEFQVTKDLCMNGFQVSAYLLAEPFRDQQLVLLGDDGRTIPLPATFRDNTLATGSVSGVQVAPGSEDEFSIACDDATDLILHDCREWNMDVYEVRFCLLRDGEGSTVRAGDVYRLGLAISFAQPSRIVFDTAAEPSVTDTRGWVPFVLPWDDAPVDLSHLNDRPAGCHGFLTVRGDEFVFEDGTPIRFWGTNFSAGANFPTHEQSEKIARRLAKFGINIVRTHHMDSGGLIDWDQADSRHFRAENLDKLDYLIHCLKENGIYVYLDQLVSRHWKDGDGVPMAAELPMAGKPYTYFNRRMIELQEEFSRNLWTHENPYTGLRYCDDPAIALMEMTNENDLFVQQVELAPYRQELEALWHNWREEEGLDPEETLRLSGPRTPEVVRFFNDMHIGFYQEMRDALRDIGVKVPICGTNWAWYVPQLLAQSTVDYMDSHCYWDHPQEWKYFRNRPMLLQDPNSQGNSFSSLAFSRLEAKPFFVSEWDQPWHNEWRAEQMLTMASVAALQGWNGLSVYTYRHYADVPMNRIAGFFETFNDPCMFGLMPTAALIFRRGDVSRARKTIRVAYPAETLDGQGDHAHAGYAVHRTGTEVSRLEGVLGGAEGVSPDTVIGRLDEGFIRSDTGELTRDWERGIATINTPRTQAAIGFLGGQGPIQLRDVTFEIDTDFAVVALTSLDDKPIRESGRLLLTAVGRAENTGFRYDALRQFRVADGGEPILIEPIAGKVTLRTAAKKLQVRALGPGGEPAREMRTRPVGDAIAFRVGRIGKTIYYEVRTDTS